MKLNLSKHQVSVILTALFEYTEICFDQGTEPANDGSGDTVAKVDKNSASYKLAIAMTKVSDVIHAQRDFYEKEKTKKLSD